MSKNCTPYIWHVHLYVGIQTDRQMDRPSYLLGFQNFKIVKTQLQIPEICTNTCIVLFKVFSQICFNRLLFERISQKLVGIDNLAFGNGNIHVTSTNIYDSYQA